MATNLFDAFDSAFAPPARPVLRNVATQVLHWLRTTRARRAEQHRRTKLAYSLGSMPRHVLKDIGYPTME
jgi:uncharacterized protein YjiS (DUF1127 family)